MSDQQHWTLVGEAGELSASASSASSAPLLPCPVEPYTQAELLSLLDRLFPASWLDSLKNPGPGYEMLQAYAKIGERLSLAVERLSCSGFILSASAGAFATGTVNLFRAALTGDGVTVLVKAGTVLKASRSGRKFVTLEDASFPDSMMGGLGPVTVAARAIAQGYEYNEPGQRTTADGTVLPGEIDTIDVLVEDPDLGDPTIQVEQINDMAGGVDPSLDLHGKDRNLRRGSGESDEAYRARVRSLPDNISPNAISRALQQLLQPFNASFGLIETWEMAYQSCYDAPRETVAGSNFDPNLFTYDDPRPSTPFRNRWLDTNDMRGGFIVVVDALAPISDVGMVLDDSALDSAALINPIGRRALCAYDVPSTVGGSFLQGFYDGVDLPRQALYRTIYSTLQSIKAAGISAVLELRGQ